MNNFSYKEVYIEDGKRVLEVNILPEKHCNFDCIFCPIGRSKNKVDKQKKFENADNSIIELGKIIDAKNPELIFINSMGEALVNDRIEDIIDFIKSKDLAVKLLSNGYILANDEYIEIANKCDEVIGEIRVATEEYFQKVQRPIDGYTLEQYVENMATFRKQYKGTFIFEVTIVKGYNDDDSSIEKTKKMIKKISPDKIEVIRIDDEPFKKKLGIDDKKFKEIKDKLLNIN